MAGTREYADDLMTLELKDGRRIHVIARGHMVNLAGPRPLGNSNIRAEARQFHEAPLWRSENWA